jgi:hypothetical protein
MSRKVRLPQSRRHLWFYDEDWDFLVEWCRAHSNLIGPGPAIRESIHARVQFLRARQTMAVDSLSQPSPALTEIPEEELTDV